MSDINQEEFMEYITFSTTMGDGKEVEMAVIDEFEFEKKNYVVAAVVEGDTINQDGMYIFKVKSGEEFGVEKIANQVDYERIAKAYLELD